MKRWMVWMSAVLLMLSAQVAYGQETWTRTHLPVTEFISRVVAVDFELQMIDVEIEAKTLALETLKKENKKRSKEHQSADEYVALYMALDYAPKALEIEIEQLVRSRDVRKRELTLEAKETYFAFKVRQDDLTALKNEVKASEDALKLKEITYQKGHMTALEFRTLQWQHEALVLERDSEERQLMVDQLKLNQMLDIPLSKNITLTTPMPEPKDDEVIAAIEKPSVSPEAYESVKRAEEALFLAKLKRETFEKHMYNSVPQLSDKARNYGSPTGYAAAKREVLEAEKALEKENRRVIIEQMIQRNALKEARSRMNIHAFQYEKAILEYEAAKVKHELGHITDQTLSQAFEGKRKAFYAYRASRRALYFAFEKI